MTVPDDHPGLVGHLTGARVVCVGDVMLDRFIYGEVSRISPEAPVPVCRVTGEQEMLGGAGNVVRNLMALGAVADFISVVGDDRPGREIKALADDLDGVNATLLVVATRPTTVKTRYITDGQQLLRADRETNDPIAAELAQDILTRARDALNGAGALVLSDYGKGVLADDMISTLIKDANYANVPVIVDPKGSDYGCYRGANLITPNRRELAEASRMATGTDREAALAAQEIVDHCGILAVLVTRGADGMTLLQKDGEDTHHLPAEAREVYDVSGAGDTVVATVAAALAGGVELPNAVGLANLAAGIVVGKIGTAVAYGVDLALAIRVRDTIDPGAEKVLTQGPAQDRIEAWRHRDEKIGFTNGCFDLVHPGHVSLLAGARAECDRLVVGLNSDGSVRRLKGGGRPVQSADDRARVLASLASVDLVVIFDDDTPVGLIEAFRPDMLAKGADYAVKDLVGADLVQGWGGRVVLVDLEPGHSTTDTIERMAK